MSSRSRFMWGDARVLLQLILRDRFRPPGCFWLIAQKLFDLTGKQGVG